MKRHYTPTDWVGYIRVSTEDQAQSGLSLEAQETKIRAMAAVKDIALSEIISDAGESAKTLNRPGVERLIEMIERRRIAGVIVSKLDRLTRSVKDLGYIVELIERKGVAIISTYETLDTATATGRMFMTLIGMISQWEREIIGERTSAALQAKKRRGERAGNVPYGHRSVEGKLVADHDEQAVIASIIAMRQQDNSLSEIARSLNEQGIRTRKGTPWKLQYVDAVLRRQSDSQDQLKRSTQ